MNARWMMLTLFVIGSLFIAGCSSGNDPVNADKDVPKKAKDKDK